jgi:hypothetical protein
MAPNSLQGAPEIADTTSAFQSYKRARFDEAYVHTQETQMLQFLSNRTSVHVFTFVTVSFPHIQTLRHKNTFAI